MKLLKNHSVMPPVFITDKPPFVKSNTVYNTSSLLEHIKKQEEFNDLLLQVFNMQKPYSRDLLERENNQETIENSIVQNPIKINEKETKLNNEKEEKDTSISNLDPQQQDRRELPDVLTKQEEKLPNMINNEKEEIEDTLISPLEHQEKPRRMLLEPIKKHKKKMPDMANNKKGEIEDSSNSNLDHQEKNRRELPQHLKKQKEKVTDLMNNQKDEIEGFLNSNLDHQEQNREDLVELIKKLEEKVTDLINNQKEEIVGTLMQHLDKQGEFIQSLMDQENKIKYFSLGDHIEVIDGDSKIDGVFIEMNNEGLIWIDNSMSLCLSSMKGIGIRKKANVDSKN